MFDPDIIKITDAITGYTIRRSISSPYLFNVVCHNVDGELLAVVESDITFDSAAELVEKLNSEVKSD